MNVCANCGRECESLVCDKECDPLDQPAFESTFGSDPYDRITDMQDGLDSIWHSTDDPLGGPAFETGTEQLDVSLSGPAEFEGGNRHHVLLSDSELRIIKALRS